MTISVEINVDIDSVPHQLERDAETGQFLAFNDELRVAATGADEAEASANFRSAVETLVRNEVAAGRAIPAPLAPFIRVPA